MLKIQTSVVLFGADGLEMNIQGKGKARLGAVCASALLHTEGPMELEQKLKRFALAESLQKKETVEVCDDELELIKSRVNAVFNIETVGAVMNALI